MAGNLYDAEVETARNDAGYGMLLLGNGKGDFRAVDRQASGFFVPYNVKDLAILRSASGKLILAGCNNDAVRAFRWEASRSD